MQTLKRPRVQNVKGKRNVQGNVRLRRVRIHFVTDNPLLKLHQIYAIQVFLLSIFGYTVATARCHDNIHCFLL